MRDEKLKALKHIVVVARRVLCVRHMANDAAVENVIENENHLYAKAK